ncbi:amino acid ABC transporter permease [Fusobacterium gastrosuis]|uniref:amino acid ABC transporter permease n=1 Tax=Fusobacterium gastrosuis TaxID=1755100 RepID=UPI002A96DC98|nr:amino acid ABC transporter permease [Fusobacterium gastrosuis]
MLSTVIDLLAKGSNFERLIYGLWITIKLSLISAGLSMLFGIVVGMIMTIKNPFVKFFTQLYLQTIRIMPPLVLLFLAYFGLARIFNLHISAEASAIMVFTIWGTAEMGDLVRGAIISIPKIQIESGLALALSKFQIYLYIIIPQTVRRLIPLTMNLITRMIKTTSLVVLIGIVEVLKVGQQIIDANRFDYPSGALWIYGVIFILCFFSCWPLSMLAKYLEKKWA